MAHKMLRRKGFTIIELLVVIVIIGLLSTLATTSYLNAQRTARDNARKTAITNISNAVEAYYAVQRQFPGKIDTTQFHAPTPSFPACEQLDQPPNNTTYLYYYFPLTQGSATVPTCDDSLRTQTGTPPAYSYDPSQFAPAPSWIPGLSSYINPFPIELNYQGANGTSQDAYGEVFTATDTNSSGPANKTRTYVYRHVTGGYVVYGRLEAGDTEVPANRNSLPSAISNSVSPGDHIFMISK